MKLAIYFTLLAGRLVAGTFIGISTFNFGAALITSSASNCNIIITHYLSQLIFPVIYSLICAMIVAKFFCKYERKVKHAKEGYIEGIKITETVTPIMFYLVSIILLVLLFVGFITKDFISSTAHIPVIPTAIVVSVIYAIIFYEKLSYRRPWRYK